MNKFFLPFFFLSIKGCGFFFKSLRKDVNKALDVIGIMEVSGVKGILGTMSIRGVGYVG